MGQSVKKIIGYSLALLAILGYFGFVAWWLVAQWHECRGMGFSAFYCLKHVL